MECFIISNIAVAIKDILQKSHAAGSLYVLS